MNLVRPLSKPRLSLTQVSGAVLGAGILALSIQFAVNEFPGNYFFFRPAWLLHPFEQEHLSIARHFAHTGHLTIPGTEAGLDPAYGSEDRGYIDGRYVPRGMLLTYFVYAVSFLISDSAWLYITPIFGFLGATGAGAILLRRTDSASASIAAAAALFFTAPYLLAASGLAFENLISLAFLLWGVYALESFTYSPSPTRGAAAGLLFAGVANTRADYAPATLLFLGVVSVWLMWAWWRLRWLPRRTVLSAAVAILTGSLGVLGVFATNYAFTGSPLHTAYGASAWQGDAAGIARNVAAFDPGDFARLTRLFLWDIGRPSAVLVAAGSLIYIVNRRFNPGDVVLAALSLFLLVLHIGRGGLHGTDEAFLVSSPPRYFLPVYATGIIIGTTAFAGLARRFSLGTFAVPAVFLSVGLLAAVGGIHEAYLNKAGIVDARLTADRHRTVHEFSLKHPDSLFVGDLDTSAIIITQRLLIPRLTGNLDDVVQAVNDELISGRRVFIVDDRRYLANNPLYSGYFETFVAQGMAVCQATRTRPAMTEVLSDRSTTTNLVTRLNVDSANGWAVFGPPLEFGARYYLTVTGTFTYNNRGSTSDGVDLWIDGQRTAGDMAASHTYCVPKLGTGEALRLELADPSRADNRGSLTVSVFRAD